MKLSVWQQFSSNHSASFTVVGIFDSVEAAKNATDEFRTILKGVTEGWVHPDYPEDASLLEQVFGEHFGFEWTRHLDWVHESEEQLHQIDNHVIISNNMVQTFRGALYIDKIMEKLGAKVLAEEEAGKYSKFAIEVELQCGHPDAKQLTALYDELNDYFTEARKGRGLDIPSPWRQTSQDLFQFDMFHTADHIFDGYVELKPPKNLKLHKLRFSSLGHGLPALLEYLKRRGFSEIEYKIEQVNWVDDVNS